MFKYVFWLFILIFNTKSFAESGLGKAYFDMGEGVHNLFKQSCEQLTQKEYDQLKQKFPECKNRKLNTLGFEQNIDATFFNWAAKNQLANYSCAKDALSALLSAKKPDQIQYRNQILKNWSDNGKIIKQLQQKIAYADEDIQKALENHDEDYKKMPMAMRPDVNVYKRNQPEKLKKLIEEKQKLIINLNIELEARMGTLLEGRNPVFRKNYLKLIETNQLTDQNLLKLAQGLKTNHEKNIKQLQSQADPQAYPPRYSNLDARTKQMLVESAIASQNFGPGLNPSESATQKLQCRLTARYITGPEIINTSVLGACMMVTGGAAGLGFMAARGAAHLALRAQLLSGVATGTALTQIAPEIHSACFANNPNMMIERCEAKSGEDRLAYEVAALDQSSCAFATAMGVTVLPVLTIANKLPFKYNSRAISKDFAHKSKKTEEAALDTQQEIQKAKEERLSSGSEQSANSKAQMNSDRVVSGNEIERSADEKMSKAFDFDDGPKKDIMRSELVKIDRENREYMNKHGIRYNEVVPNQKAVELSLEKLKEIETRIEVNKHKLMLLKKDPKADQAKIKFLEAEIEMDESTITNLVQYEGFVESELEFLRQKGHRFIVDDVKEGTDLYRTLHANPQLSAKVYRINKSGLPEKKGPARWDTPALLHPEMDDYMKYMEAIGVELRVDSSLGASNTLAFYINGRKALYISPKTNMAVFEHEFRHAEFDEFVRNKFNDVKESVKAGQKIQANFDKTERAIIGDRSFKTMQKLLNLEHTEVAVNETLAVQRELERMGWHRFTPASFNARMYAKYHQIRSFNEQAYYKIANGEVTQGGAAVKKAAQASESRPHVQQVKELKDALLVQKALTPAQLNAYRKLIDEYIMLHRLEVTLGNAKSFTTKGFGDFRRASVLSVLNQIEQYQDRDPIQDVFYKPNGETIVVKKSGMVHIKAP